MAAPSDPRVLAAFSILTGHALAAAGVAAWRATRPLAAASAGRDGAVTAESDAKRWRLFTQAEANRVQGGEEDVVADIAVGF